MDEEFEGEHPSEMERLAEELLALILVKINDSDDRKSLSLVCKQWFRAEGISRVALHVLDPNRLPNFLPRYPNLLKFRSSVKISNFLIHFVANTCPKIEVLNLDYHIPKGQDGAFSENVGIDDFDDEGLRCIAKGLPELEAVMLRHRDGIGNTGVASLGNFSKKLRILNLGWCKKVGDEAFTSIGKLEDLEVLNLQGCCFITDWGLGYLADGSASNSLKSLNLSFCDQITDRGVIELRHITCLEELNLGYCGPKVTDVGIESGVAVMTSLKKLDLSWLENVSDHALTALNVGCWGLEVLDLTGCEKITAAGICALSGFKSLRELVLTNTDCDISSDDLEQLVFGCPTLAYVALDYSLKEWISKSVQENILKRNCVIDWKNIPRN